MSRYETFKKNIDLLIGIDLDYYKEKQMKRRITSLMNRNGIDNFDDYFKRLEIDEILLEQFINYLTINVSEFYRNPLQWRVLEYDILPNLMSNVSKPLKLWSSACSTGEEPYSLVMLLSKYYDLNKIKVLATDIDDGAIQKAKVGIYQEKALANLPLQYKNNFFSKDGNHYKIKAKVQNSVEFRKLDLLKDSFPRDIDLITCRNVMIYFTEKAKDKLYRKFYASLSKSGILFVGSTEQIILPERYNYKAVKSFFYSKIK